MYCYTFNHPTIFKMVKTISILTTYNSEMLLTQQCIRVKAAQMNISLMHYGNVPFFSTKDLLLCPQFYLKEVHSDLWELSVQINKYGSYLFVSRAAEAFSWSPESFLLCCTRSETETEF